MRAVNAKQRSRPSETSTATLVVGDPRVVPQSRVPQAKDTGGISFKAISNGQSYTCGLSAPESKAYCWGRCSGAEVGSRLPPQKPLRARVRGDGESLSRLLPLLQVSANLGSWGTPNSGHHPLQWP